MLDHSALRFNQMAIIILLVLAFLFDQIWLVAFVAAVMLVGTWWPNAGLFKLVYKHVLKPHGILQPQMVADEQAPHLFAQGLGGLMLAVSVVALGAGLAVLGWLLVGIVVALAAVNLFLHFCLGCYLYYQFARRGVRLALPGWQ
ncbi:MAG: DUF4395 domain-containing protein [Caldilinea sp. CFX5]|nr:DUF4395 domain-containing protein [Caldilinea sp. CFX5]